MKKALAVVGATTIGAGAAVLSAAPAVADPVTTPCEGFEAHTTPVEELPDNWYMDCVPQYGMGKAEFTIWADDGAPAVEEFPADFLPLNFDDVEASTTLDPELSEYMPGPMQKGAWIQLGERDADALSRTYVGFVAAPITGVQRVTDENLEEAWLEQCGPVMFGGDPETQPVGFVATYGQTDTTFTQSIDGEEWAYEITTTPLPTAFFFYPDAQDGIVPGSPMCATDGVSFIGGFFGVEQLENFVFQTVVHSPNFPDEIETPEDLFDALRFIGDFYRQVDAPAEPAAPTLPATGREGMTLVATAGALGGFGAALLAVAGIRSGVRIRSASRGES